MRELSFLLDLDFGKLADANVSFTANGGLLIDEVFKNVGQGYLSYKPRAVRGFVLDVGKLAQHLGYEVAQNTFTAGLYVYNDWNSLYHNNSGKTFGLQLKYTGTPGLTVVYNNIYGPEQALNNSNMKFVNEVNATYSLNDRLSLAVDGLLGSEERTGASKAKWRALTLYAKGQVVDFWSISPRFEVYNDQDGYTLAANNHEVLQGYTLTNAFRVSKGFEFRLEGRHDRSTEPTRFVGRDRNHKTQTTVPAGFLFTI